MCRNKTKSNLVQYRFLGFFAKQRVLCPWAPGGGARGFACTPWPSVKYEDIKKYNKTNGIL